MSNSPLKTYYIITYGCQMNEHDSENLAGMLENMGWIPAENEEEAQLIIMNTCSVRENADNRFYGTLGQFKKRKTEDPDFILCVTGCMPQQEKVQREIREHFGWVDILFGTQTLREFPQLLEARLRTGKKQISILADNPVLPKEEGAKRMHKHKAFVNITYGCNNFCTYCIVPYTRGREKSRSLESVVQEVRELASEGVVEISLLGQNVNSFRDGEGNTFPDLLRALDGIPGIERIRFMTSNPKDLSEELIACFRDLSHLCRHIHLPVQSGSSRILKRMNRRYDRERYLDVVRRLREACPDIAITTDIIVGFPGETEEDFLETVALVREVRYDAAFTFIYSPREGTPAATFPDQIPEDVKHDRLNRLNEAVNEGAYAHNKALEGLTLPVLVDGKSRRDDRFYQGRTDGFKLVNFKADRDYTGEIVPVCLTECKTFSLNGEVEA